MQTFSQGGNVQLDSSLDNQLGMGGPDEEITPANSGIPLVEGGNPAWNDFLQYVPEDKRQEVVPTLKQWDEHVNKMRADYEPWKNLGTTPDQAEQAIKVKNLIESQPQAVYERLGEYLGVSTKEAKKIVEEEAKKETETAPTGTPDLEKLQNTVNYMAQILLAQKQEQESTEAEKAEDAKLDAALKELKKKYGDFDEEEVVMRAVHRGLSVEKALEEWKAKEAEILKRRPAPWLLGGGGEIPSPTTDPRKLDRKATKDLIAQTIHLANMEGNK
jgi:hypothetical protein